MIAKITICITLFIQSPIELDRATTYNATVDQCDSDPLGTACGARIDTVKLRNKELRWCALSRDLIYNEYRQKLHDYDTTIFRGFFEFGDTIHVKSDSMPHVNGFWVVMDCMNARYSMAIDFLFDPRNNVPKLGVLNDVEILNK